MLLRGQVLDSLALNCSQHVRSLLADKKSIKRLVNLATERTPAAGAAFQVFVNWSFIYRCVPGTLTTARISDPYSGFAQASLCSVGLKV